jgi:hypothetical protein
MTALMTILRDCAMDLLERKDTVDPEQIVSCAWSKHGDVFEVEQQRLILDAAKRMAKDVLRSLSDDSDAPQLVLPGLGLPSVIAVPTDEGFAYVRTDKAVWSQLQAGRSLRNDNVKRAQAKLDEYDRAMEKLAPIMAGNPTITVREATGAQAVAS